MARFGTFAATMLWAASAMLVPALASDGYDLWIWSEDRAHGPDETELVMIVHRGTNAAAAARRNASGDLIWADADNARDEFEARRAEPIGAAVVEIGDAQIRGRVRDDRAKGASSKTFQMHVDEDSVSIRIGDAVVIEADGDHAHISIDDKVLITANDGDDGALVIIGGMDADDAADAIDDLDDASRDLKRRMKRAVGL